MQALTRKTLCEFICILPSSSIHSLGISLDAHPPVAGERQTARRGSREEAGGLRGERTPVSVSASSSPRVPRFWYVSTLSSSVQKMASAAHECRLQILRFCDCDPHCASSQHASNHSRCASSYSYPFQSPPLLLLRLLQQIPNSWISSSISPTTSPSP